MSSVPALQGFAEETFATKFQRFMSELSPEERKTSLITGEIQGLCEEGFAHFDVFCEDPMENDTFFVHLAGTDTADGCSMCREAFIKHVLEVVPD